MIPKYSTAFASGGGTGGPASRGKVWLRIAAILITGWLVACSCFAQNTITNVMSPVASYQYFDSLNDQSNSVIAGLPVSYQYFDSLNDFGTNSPIVSTVASYQYFQSPPAGSAQFLNSLEASYLYPFMELGLSFNNGAPLVSLWGANGESYPVEASTNLVTWIALTNVTIVFPAGLVQFTDPASTNYNYRFYRAVIPAP